MTTELKTNPAYFYVEDCDLAEFVELTSQTQSINDLEFASDVQKNIPIYDVASLKNMFEDECKRKALMAEWSGILMHGAGIVVLQNAYEDTSVIDRATEFFNDIIDAEKKTNGQSADHFASGNNDRIWNSLQKLCEVSPLTHVQYFTNQAIDTICEAWLGPNYQMTAQVNVVHPGGEAQTAHRDYHLGYLSPNVSKQYPAHVHDLSPVLTLQGGVAHVDMPIESGPTNFLPFSQSYRAGYAAWRRDDFKNYFEANYVQLALKKGDAVFFNPALFHSAGANSSKDIQRMVNLLQVSSAFGRSMESVNRVKMSKLVYPVLQSLLKENKINQADLSAVIASTGEGYSFPTNLDLDPPSGGLASQTQQALMKRALDEDWDMKEFNKKLDEQFRKKIA